MKEYSNKIVVILFWKTLYPKHTFRTENDSL